jgi:hypothetical protein
MVEMFELGVQIIDRIRVRFLRISRNSRHFTGCVRTYEKVGIKVIVGGPVVLPEVQQERLIHDAKQVQKTDDAETPGGFCVWVDRWHEFDLGQRRLRAFASKIAVISLNGGCNARSPERITKPNPTFRAAWNWLWTIHTSRGMRPARRTRGLAAEQHRLVAACDPHCMGSQ